MKLAVVGACSNPSRPIRRPSPASSGAHAVCPTCPLMLTRKPALGSLIARQLEARPTGVAESGDGGSWVELVFQHRHWLAWSTLQAVSPLPVTTNSLRSTAILETLWTSTISLLIIAVRSPAFRAGRVGISAQALAASKARPESKKGVGIMGGDIRCFYCLLTCDPASVMLPFTRSV
jgi:hypothetical protein